MPDVPTILGGVALVFFVIALAMKGYAVTLYEFVDVHVVEAIDDADDTNRIAGVGVYRSEIDTVNVENQTAVDAADLPPLQIETASTEFPLLFPAQVNFMADLIPINRETLAAFEQVALRNQVDLTTVLGPLIDDIVDNELDSCEQYVSDTEADLIAYFTGFLNNTIPLSVNGISNLIANDINSGIQSVQDLYTGNTTALFIAETVDIAIAGIIADEDDNIDIPPECSPATELSFAEAADEVCVNTVLTVLGGASPFQNAIADALFSDVIAQLVVEGSADCAQITIGQCIVGVIGLEYVDEPTVGAINTDNFDCDDFCNGIATQGELLGRYGDVLTIIAGSIGGDQGNLILEAVQTANNLLAGGLLNAGGFQGVQTLVSASVPSVEDSTMQRGDAFGLAENYLEVCGFIQLAAGLAGISVGEAEGCNFNTFLNGDYLGGIINASDPVAGATVLALQELIADLPELENGIQLLTIAFIDGAFGVLGEGVDPNDLEELVVQECEDNNIDQEKVTQGGNLVTSSLFFQSVAIVFALIGVLGLARGITFLVAASSAILAGSCTIAGLLVVASAPVYDGVGVEPEGIEPTFIQGVVPLLGLVDAILMLIAGVITFVAVFLHFRSSGDDNVEQDAKEVKAVVPQATGDIEEKL